MAKKRKSSKKRSGAKVSRKRRVISVKKFPVKLKKYPKRPKASASTARLASYVEKLEAIKKENADRVALAADIGKFIK